MPRGELVGTGNMPRSWIAPASEVHQRGSASRSAVAGAGWVAEDVAGSRAVLTTRGRCGEAKPAFFNVSSNAREPSARAEREYVKRTIETTTVRRLQGLSWTIVALCAEVGGHVPVPAWEEWD